MEREVGFVQACQNRSGDTRLHDIGAQLYAINGDAEAWERERGNVNFLLGVFRKQATFNGLESETESLNLSVALHHPAQVSLKPLGVGPRPTITHQTDQGNLYH